MDLLETKTAHLWKRIGTKKKAGVVCPLFSIYSSESTGIGEIPDLKLLTDWCVQTGISIIQLLPMNDTGYDFAPYSAQSTFALDPMYLRIENIKGVDVTAYEKDIAAIKKDFPCTGRVNYDIKKAKLELFGKMFEDVKLSDEYNKYRRTNRYWLEDYALYRVLKDEDERQWEVWKLDYKTRSHYELNKLKHNKAKEIEFYKWLQWQLCLQFKDVKEYANSKGVLIMGDIPFLVNRDSADVWADRRYFKLSAVSGAPPDMYMTDGQRWGMPPYNWNNIFRDNFKYICERLKYAENFYDMYRIDHFIGLFRIWTIDVSEPLSSGGRKGKYIPEAESEWELQGRKILQSMLQSSSMLPCAEDLGTVPQCSYEVLEEYGIPGMEVQRWTRVWSKTGFKFRSKNHYRKNASAVLSTHDSSTFLYWWDYECGTMDNSAFERFCKANDLTKKNITGLKKKLFDTPAMKQGILRWKRNLTKSKFAKALSLYENADDIYNFYNAGYGERERFAEFCGRKLTRLNVMSEALRAINKSSSVFSVQLLHEWLSLDKNIAEKHGYDRVNLPGFISGTNWSFRLSFPIEEMLKFRINAKIKTLNQETGRD